MSGLTWERTEPSGELLVAVNGPSAPETGATVVVRVRDGETANSYLDFADGIFKVAGWTTLDGAMAEVTTGGTVGHYRRAIDLTAITLPGTNRLIAEYRVTAPTGFPQDADVIQLVTNYQDIADESVQQAAHAQTQADVAALNDLSQAGVQSAMAAQGYTAARGPLLDNLDALVSSRGTANAGDAMALTPAERTATAGAILTLDISTLEPSAARNLLRAVQKLVNRIENTGALLNVYRTDDATVDWAQATTVSAGAAPIIELDTV